MTLKRWALGITGFVLSAAIALSMSVRAAEPTPLTVADLAREYHRIRLESERSTIDIGARVRRAVVRNELMKSYFPHCYFTVDEKGNNTRTCGPWTSEAREAYRTNLLATNAALQGWADDTIGDIGLWVIDEYELQAIRKSAVQYDSDKQFQLHMRQSASRVALIALSIAIPSGAGSQAASQGSRAAQVFKALKDVSLMGGILLSGGMTGLSVALSPEFPEPPTAYLSLTVRKQQDMRWEELHRRWLNDLRADGMGLAAGALMGYMATSVARQYALTAAGLTGRVVPHVLAIGAAIATGFFVGKIEEDRLMQERTQNMIRDVRENFQAYIHSQEQYPQDSARRFHLASDLIRVVYQLEAFRFAELYEPQVDMLKAETKIAEAEQKRLEALEKAGVANLDFTPAAGFSAPDGGVPSPTYAQPGHETSASAPEAEHFMARQKFYGTASYVLKEELLFSSSILGAAREMRIAEALAQAIALASQTSETSVLPQSKGHYIVPEVTFFPEEAGMHARAQELLDSVSESCRSNLPILFLGKKFKKPQYFPCVIKALDEHRAQSSQAIRGKVTESAFDEGGLADLDLLDPVSMMFAAAALLEREDSSLMGNWARTLRGKAEKHLKLMNDVGWNSGTLSFAKTGGTP